MSTDGAGTALVTGASAGIGRALAREFAAGGYDLAVVARREERLRTLADEVADEHGTTTEVVTMDLAEPGAAEALQAAVDERDVRVDALVNNVGVGAYGRFHETDLERELTQVRLNVELPVHLTKLYLPRLVERDDGLVLNVASLAAFQPGPKMAGYYASKAYLLSLSEALATEYRDTDVSVTALCPGPVSTEFQDRADMHDSRIGSTFSHTVEEVASAGYRGAIAGDPVVVPGVPMKLLYLSTRLAPRVMKRRTAAWINADR